ncbi:Predicted DNA-binding transcriptional regulator YafY, contains an HTH and WYL domains [Agromyces sp. CF514]|uniref:helix-turn-helix transcriptional regulator n=1 Tax=Agromyces sp. CF514 TaxID=1881031 RepID=UPI0008E17B83|nr:WYL domain-containing protein [Agromyces sp. CF514]SFR70855.1 Predicted DNA-binding transcriptional regulator YafY, contains an HTH and WYL domains [Agromyces sp. CF514]
MTDTAGRLLALLGLLQSRPSWSGPELAERLGVTTRTIRNDVERLRALDYPVAATRGSIGGYRLGAGGRLPPLLLDDEEAVAVAIGLRAATGVAGVAESSRRALAKLEQVLPPRLRPTVEAFATVVDNAPANNDTDAPDPEVDPEVLRAIATAIRSVEWLRFDYGDRGDGDRGDDRSDVPRLVEPYRLLSWLRRWYLVARDPESGEWDVFRADRMRPRMPTRRRFDPRLVPGGDYTAFTMRQVAVSGWIVHARLRIAAPASAVLERIHSAVGIVEAVSPDESMLVTGADSLDTIAAYIGMLGMDFTVESPPELRDLLRVYADRYRRAADAASVT